MEKGTIFFIYQSLDSNDAVLASENVSKVVTFMVGDDVSI
jgi:hypothetical protein